MKKLMTFAAVAAMTVVASAVDTDYGDGLSNVEVLRTPGLTSTVCPDCGAGVGAATDCKAVVFKVTGSGKAVTASSKGSYKTVTSLKIKKGALALEGTYCGGNNTCCYDNGYFFATIKVGKKVFKVGTPVDVKVWSLFGKNLEKARYYGTEIKKGKNVCLESALFVMAPEDSEAWEGVEFEDGEPFAFWASSFGKVDFKVSTKDASYCVNGECAAIYTPKKYNGWFVGWYPCVVDENCFRCGCEAVDVFGGTWKAAYQKSLKTISAAQGLAGTSFVLD